MERASKEIMGDPRRRALSQHAEHEVPVAPCDQPTFVALRLVIPPLAQPPRVAQAARPTLAGERLTRRLASDRGACPPICILARPVCCKGLFALPGISTARRMLCSNSVCGHMVCCRRTRQQPHLATPSAPEVAASRDVKQQQRGRQAEDSVAAAAASGDGTAAGGRPRRGGWR